MQDENASQMSFQDFVIASLQRIHQVSCDVNRSFVGFAHRSAIEQLWYSVPSEKKKGFLEQWQEIQDRFTLLSEQPEDEQERLNTVLVGELMQALTDCLHANNQLFRPENPQAKAWRAAGNAKP